MKYHHVTLIFSADELRYIRRCIGTKLRKDVVGSRRFDEVERDSALDRRLKLGRKLCTLLDGLLGT